VKIVILAGGGGTRLFPLSTEERPKQFIKIDGYSLIQHAARRYRNVAATHDLVIVTAEKYRPLLREQLKEIDAENAHIVGEPCRKNTAPAVALAVKYIEEKLVGGSKNADEPIFVGTADHLIGPQEQFDFYVKRSGELAAMGKVATLGIKPTLPETNYGYIKAPPRGQQDHADAERFVEKPNLETAKEYVKSGEYYWNSGMFCFTAATLKEELKLYRPELHAAVFGGTYADAERNFPGVAPISFDYAVAEKSRRVAMIYAGLDWSDVGGFAAFHAASQKDADGNHIGGAARLSGCSGCYIETARPVYAAGLRNLVVIEKDGALYIADMDGAGKFKELVR
jgi:mannose-1-phosphate guanylyltransferase/mannose-6-phosphate isomerase